MRSGIDFFERPNQFSQTLKKSSQRWEEEMESLQAYLENEVCKLLELRNKKEAKGIKTEPSEVDLTSKITIEKVLGYKIELMNKIITRDPLSLKELEIKRCIERINIISKRYIRHQNLLEKRLKF